LINTLLTEKVRDCQNSSECRQKTRCFTLH